MGVLKYGICKFTISSKNKAKCMREKNLNLKAKDEYNVYKENLDFIY